MDITEFRNLSRKISRVHSPWLHKGDFKSELHLAHVISESSSVGFRFGRLVTLRILFMTLRCYRRMSKDSHMHEYAIRSSSSIELISPALILFERENENFRSRSQLLQSFELIRRELLYARLINSKMHRRTLEVLSFECWMSLRISIQIKIPLHWDSFENELDYTRMREEDFIIYLPTKRNAKLVKAFSSLIACNSNVAGSLLVFRLSIKKKKLCSIERTFVVQES